MKNFEEQKEFSKLLDNAKENLFFDYLKSKRNSFEFADVAQILAKEKNDEDLLFVSDAFTRWIENSKREEQKKELLGLLQGIWRVSSYCVNLETISKAAISKYIDLDKRNTELVRSKKSLELELNKKIESLENEKKQLKSEIDFINNSK